MRIGIDARFVGPQGTGLGKYTEKLVENLQKIDKKNHYFIFLGQSNWSYLKLKAKNFTKVLADVQWYSLEEQLKMPAIYRSQKLDILHVPHFNVPIMYRKRFIVTIHDLIHHHFAQESTTTKNILVYKLKRLFYKLTIKNAINKSQVIIAPSNFVKQEITTTFNIPQSKIKVIYEAGEEEYQIGTENKADFLKKYKIQRPFIMYVGNAYPHKNLENLFQAMKIMKNKNKLNLVVVTARSVFAKRLKDSVDKMQLGNCITLTGYIPSQELKIILKQAQAYVFPTLSEGFGIPAINAMLSGIPAIVSDIPVLKEVYKDAAVYFDPKDPKDIAGKIEKVLGSPSLKEEKIKLGYLQAKKYSWLKMAKQTLKVYESNAV